MSRKMSLTIYKVYHIQSGAAGRAADDDGAVDGHLDAAQLLRALLDGHTPAA